MFPRHTRILIGCILVLSVATAVDADDFELIGGFWPGVATAPALHPGDMDCDGDVDFDDIDPFVMALTSQAGYEAAYPDCIWLNADTDGDGNVDFDDIDAFVAILSGG